MSDPAQKERKDFLRRWAMELPAVKSDGLIEGFLALPEVKRADTVFLFYGVGNEPDTRPLIECLLEQGKRVALPVCLSGRRMETREIRALNDLAPGRFGIPAPGPECPPLPKDEIEVVLVPNLLCDRNGYRLGYGGGYYDRWLADYTGVTVSFCPPERLVEELPRDSFDIPVQILILK